MRKTRLELMGIVLIAALFCIGVDAQARKSTTKGDSSSETSTFPLEPGQETLPYPSQCTITYQPVCGVNGVTYLNACFAGVVEIAHSGTCYVPDTCDDRAGVDWGSCSPRFLGAAMVNGACANIFGCEIPSGVELFSDVAECESGCAGCANNGQCAPEEYCRFPDEDPCGIRSLGSCSLKSEVCIHVYDPICGCDGNIYSNECHADAAGINTAHYGECEPPVTTLEHPPNQDGDCECHTTGPMSYGLVEASGSGCTSDCTGAGYDSACDPGTTNCG